MLDFIDMRKIVNITIALQNTLHIINSDHRQRVQNESCKYISNFLRNKSHISEYGMYCSILNSI